MADGPAPHMRLVDDAPVVAWQLRPDTWGAVASWCHGFMGIDQDGNQCIALGSLTNMAHLGDWVVRDDAQNFTPIPAEDFLRLYVVKD